MLLTGNAIDQHIFKLAVGGPFLCQNHLTTVPMWQGEEICEMDLSLISHGPEIRHGPEISSESLRVRDILSPGSDITNGIEGNPTA